LPAFALAETVILKSGKTVEGKLIEQTDKYIKIYFQGVQLTYSIDEIESVDGKRFLSDSISGADGQNLQSNIINSNSKVIEDIKTAKPYFSNDDILSKTLLEISKKFWSQRWYSLIREMMSRYGEPLAYWILFILSYFILPSAIILITILLFKFIKFPMPIPVSIVFGVLITNVVFSIGTYLLAADTLQYVTKVKTLFPYERNVIEIADALLVVTQHGDSFGLMKVKVFVVGTIYTFAAFNLLTLHKSARKIILEGLKYVAIFTLISTLFGRASGESLFVCIISLFIAQFCLDEKYFQE